MRIEADALVDTIHYTATAAGATVVAEFGVSWFGLQVTGVGAAATAWTVKLEVSMTGVVGSFKTILTHSTGDGDGIPLWPSTQTLARFFRSNVTVLTLGSATALTVTIIAKE